MSTVQTKQTNLREKLAELLDFRKMRDRLSGLGLYIGKDRTGTGENLLVRGGANVDDLQIGEIAALVGGTAVDVFVYDTSRDSDGGAWRKRTQHTSWYNEELNTATRGGRREFPAVVLVVTEADRVVLYDADDSDLSMWMIFNTVDIDSSSGNYNVLGHTGREATKGTAMNGEFLFCSKNNQNQTYINFITEQSLLIYQTIDIYKGNISQRNNNAHYIGYMDIPGGRFAQNHAIVDRNVHDVAMTVLPNARIDQNTGLPVPTIAVATDGGVSVIKDDGTVVDLNVYDRPYSSVYFSGNVVWAVENPETDYDLLRYFEIPTSDITAASSYGPNSSPALFPENTKGNIFDSFNYGSPIGITKLDHEGSMVAYTTSKYNTGWMPGDIKLATLSDTTVETIGVNSDNLLTGDSSTFDNGTGDWESDSDAVLIHNASGGYLQVGNGGADNTFACRKYIYFDTSKNYIITARVRPTFTGSYRFRVRIGANEYYSTTSALTSGQWTEISTTVFSAEVNWLEFGSEGGTITTFDIDDITIRETTELITNGDFSTDVTGWSFTSGASISHDTTEYTGGALQINQNSSSGQGAYQSINTIIGQSYVLNVIGKGDSIVNPSNLVVEIGTSIMGSELGGQIVGAGSVEGNVSITFVASSTITYISLGPTGSDTRVAYVDNISVRPAVEDRSVNNNGLQIVGEINKTPVASGADLVAYSGFSANNYLVQSYNEDLNFGTGDFCVMGWARSSGASQAYISIGPESGTGARVISGADSENRWFFTVYDNTDDNSTRYLSRNLTAYSNDYNWVHFIGGRKDGVFFFYLNGVEQSDDLGTASNMKDLTNTNATEVELTIGANWQKTAGGGELTLVRISKTAPTAEQIAKIYRDEKVLFQDGAQATLYGTSDSVTALAYDEKMQLLHVGTASGRSDFYGLRRINNTTTAITTSISAHNNLIAEQ